MCFLIRKLLLENALLYAFQKTRGIASLRLRNKQWLIISSIGALMLKTAHFLMSCLIKSQGWKVSKGSRLDLCPKNLSGNVFN